MRRSLIILGLTNIIAQILFVRELLATFYGNELVICVFFALWFFIITVGSWVSRPLSRTLVERSGANEMANQDFESEGSGASFITCLLLIALLLPLELIAIRGIRRALGIIAPSFAFAPDGTVAFLPMLCSIFIVIFPLALILGFSLSLAYRIVLVASRNMAGRGVVDPYVFETTGAIIGGALYGYLLIHIFSSSFLSAILCLSILNLTVAVIFWYRSSRGNQFLIFLIGPLLLFFVIITCVPQLNGIAEVLSWTLSLPNYQKILSWDTAYGRINVGENNGEYELVQNGLTVGMVNPPGGSRKKRREVEEIIHIPLLYHPNPRNVLLIGGANGALREVFKHTMARVHYAEPDPKIIDISRSFVEKDDRPIFQSRRVTVHDDVDARLFVKYSAERLSAGDKFDVIIVNLPDPLTGFFSRFYTKEFFEELRKILKPDGIVSISLTSFNQVHQPGVEIENYDVNSGLRQLTASVYYTLKAVYKVILTLPGSRNIFLASNSSQYLSVSLSKLIWRLEDREIETESLENNSLEWATDMEQKKLLSIIEGTRHKRLNLDLAPIPYLYSLCSPLSMRLGGERSLSRAYPKLAKVAESIFDELLTMDLSWIAVGVTVFTVLFSLCAIISNSPLRVAVPVAIFCSGISGLALQMVIIFTFQALYGFIYQHIVIIITTFMFGITLGALTYSGTSDTESNPPTSLGMVFLITQILMALCAALLPFLFGFLGPSRGDSDLFELATIQIVFPFLSSIPGFLIGVQLSSAGKIYASANQPVDEIVIERCERPRIAYLLGASFGALICGLVLIPMFGMVGTCYAAAIVSIGSVVVMLFAQH